MTKRDAAIIMAYTGYVTLQGENLVQYGRYVSEILGRPVFTHEIPSLSDEIREKSKPDFIKLCESATDDDALEPIDIPTPPCNDVTLSCPTCRKPIVNAYSSKEYKPKFCSECGQKLKW